MVTNYLKQYHCNTLALLMLLTCCTPITRAEETLGEKIVEHGTKVASDLKEAATDIGTKTVHDATSTLRRIFNLFADIPERTVNQVKTAAKRIVRESSFFAHELQDLGAVIKESAHDLAQNARSLGHRVGQIGANIIKTECNQLAIILTMPSFITPAEIATITETIATYTEEEMPPHGSSEAALEIVQAIAELIRTIAQHTTDIHLDVAWGISDERIRTYATHDASLHTSQISIVLNSAYNLHEWPDTVDDVLRIQHYAKKNENTLLVLDAVENLLKKAIHHSLFKSVHII